MTVPAIGTRLRNNDGRYQDQIIVVTGYAYHSANAGIAEPGPISTAPGSINRAQVTHVTYHSKRRKAAIRLDRIYNDGKKRLVGYNVIP